jgi:hypothetical protein
VKALSRTKAEQARFDRMKEICICVACYQRKLHSGYIQIHHLNIGGLAGQKRRGHMYTISLCLWHHLGQLMYGYNKKDLREIYGPSLAEGSKPFHFWFGSDEELLATQNRLLAHEYD